MNNLYIKLLVMIERLKDDERGQDLIEYALVVAFICFAATAGMTTLAGKINAAFSTLGTDLTAAIS